MAAPKILRAINEINDSKMGNHQYQDKGYNICQLVFQKFNRHLLLDHL